MFTCWGQETSARALRKIWCLRRWRAIRTGARFSALELAIRKLKCNDCKCAYCWWPLTKVDITFTCKWRTCMSSNYTGSPKRLLFTLLFHSEDINRVCGGDKRRCTMSSVNWAFGDIRWEIGKASQGSFWISLEIKSDKMELNSWKRISTQYLLYYLLMMGKWSNYDIQLIFKKSSYNL